MKRISHPLCPLFGLLLFFFLLSLSSPACAAESTSASSPPRLLTITKLHTQNGQELPLPNVSFDLYQVATTAELESGSVTLHAQPTRQELTRYRTSSGYVTTLVTDANGCASWNFTEHGLPDGIYLLVEHYSTARSGITQPFYLSVPGISPQNDPVYIQNIRSGTANSSAPALRSEVSAPGCTSASFDVGSDISFLLRSDLPREPAVTDLTLSNTLDYRLTYRPGTPVVTLCPSTGETIPLQQGLHYLLTEEAAGSGETVNRFTVTLTQQGLSLLSSPEDAESRSVELCVVFQAMLNEHADPGEPIPNSAWLSCTFSDNTQTRLVSNASHICTGGLLIRTVSADGLSLSGSTFRLARAATAEELRSGSAEVCTLHQNGPHFAAVFLPLHPTDSRFASKKTAFTLPDDGSFLLSGLAYGTYYLVQTKAPSGTARLSQPICVQVDETSHLTPIFLNNP